MTDENTSNVAPSHSESSDGLNENKGQMLVIYLPEGSVIVDRTDVNLAHAPQAIVEHIPLKAEPTVAPVAPVAAVAPTAPEPMQSTLQEVVQLAVQEVLKITTGAQGATHVAVSPAVEAPATVPVVPPVVETSAPVAERNVTNPDYPAPAATQDPFVEAEIRQTPVAKPSAHVARRVHVRRRRKINWVHGINTALVAYLLIVAIFPAVMSSAFGMAVYASKNAHPGALIAKGDLMVCTELPASKLKVNDILLVRDGNSWHLDARQVTSISTAGDLSTVSTASTGGVAIDKTYVLPRDSGSYKVSRVIPKLGIVPIILSSTIVKLIGGLLILALNLIVHYRRLYRRRLELGGY